MKSTYQYKISIILPVYNVESYIEACINSIVSQTLTEDIECIIVDDCGQDHSMEIIYNCLSIYSGTIDFRVIHHQSNKGLSAARNSGIVAARGEYVYFMDSDDVITPNCMKTFMQILNKYKGVDLIQGLIKQNSVYMNQFMQKELPCYTENREYIKKALLDYDELPICAANKMIKRMLIINNNLYFKEGIIHEDNYWSFFLAKYVKSIAINREVCYLYTENPSSITKKINLEKERESFLTIIYDFCSNIDSFMRGEQKRCVFVLLRHFITNKFYNSDSERELTIGLLEKECNILERLLLWNWKNNINNKVNERKWSKRLTCYFRCNSVSLLYEKIKEKVFRKIFICWNPWLRSNVINPWYRRKVKNRNVSILCNNCVGGIIAHDLGLKFASPLVNLWMYPKDFIKFCKNLEYYLNCELKFSKSEDITYPVAKLNDITIYFQHYHTDEEAKKKWELRKKRINFGNIRCILVERDGCTTEDIKEFSDLPFPAMSLVHKKMPDLKKTCYISGFENENELGDIIRFKLGHYCGRRYLDDFNFLGFINGEQ